MLGQIPFNSSLLIAEFMQITTLDIYLKSELQNVQYSALFSIVQRYLCSFPTFPTSAVPMLVVLSFKAVICPPTGWFPRPFEEFGDENKRMLANRWQRIRVPLVTQPDLHGCTLMGLQGIAVKRQQGEIDEAEDWFISRASQAMG